MKQVNYIYDIHGCKNEVKTPNRQLQVIFTTEQTEGRNRKMIIMDYENK